MSKSYSEVSTFKETVDEIVVTHHSLLKRELPRINGMVDELATLQVQNESMDEARQIFKKVRLKIETHMKDEESILFPFGIARETGKLPSATELDMLARLVEMEKEHDGCTNALGTICALLSNTPPNALRDQCLSTVGLVIEDLRIHANKENTTVHPRLIEFIEGFREESV